MRTSVVTRYKEPLQQADILEPVAGEQDVLIRVEAAGLNPSAEKIRAPEFEQVLPGELALALGNDVAGTAAGAQAGVRSLQPGDEVYARPSADRIGTSTERAAIAGSNLATQACVGLERGRRPGRRRSSTSAPTGSVQSRSTSPSISAPP